MTLKDGEELGWLCSDTYVPKNTAIHEKSKSEHCKLLKRHYFYFFKKPINIFVKAFKA